MLVPTGKRTSPTCHVAGQGYLAYSLRRRDLTSTSSMVPGMAGQNPTGHTGPHQGFFCTLDETSVHQVPSLPEPQCMLLRNLGLPLKTSGQMPLGKQNFSVH
jgi:hypothetical protein